MSTAFKATPDVIIRTADFGAATQFYSEVMGLNVAHSDPSLVGFDTGSFRLYVEQGKSHGPVFEFRVPDLEAAKLRLIEAGCTILEENAAIPRCYIRDPYGLVFNIEERS